MSLRNRSAILAVGVVLGGWATSPAAALLLYDSFDQPAGAIAGTGSTSGVWPGTGKWTGTGTGTVSAGSLSYGPLKTFGNQANYDAVANASRAIGATLGGASTDLWYSFLIAANRNDSGISLFTGATEQNFMGNGGGSGQTLGLQNPNLNTGVAQTTATHLYVLHMVTPASGNVTTTLFIDPTFASLGTGAAPTGSLYTNAASPDTTRAAYGFDTVRLGAFNSAGTVRFDEFRVGTTWADVSPVPEPTSAAAAALAAAGGLLARRRRHAGR